MQLEKATQITNTCKSALDIITKHVNLATGIYHPLDLNKAVDVFDQLYETGDYIHPDEVKNYLIAEGWKERHAHDVSIVWMTVATLKDFQYQRCPRPVKQGLLLRQR